MQLRYRDQETKKKKREHFLVLAPGSLLKHVTAAPWWGLFTRRQEDGGARQSADFLSGAELDKSCFGVGVRKFYLWPVLCHRGLSPHITTVRIQFL